jgi:hypothetical protein
MGCLQSGDHVPHRAADQIKIGLELDGEFLDADHRRALLRRQAAFELEHIIRHAFTILGRTRHLPLSVPVPDQIYCSAGKFPRMVLSLHARG